MTDYASQVRSRMAEDAQAQREIVDAFVSSVNQPSPERFVKALNGAINRYVLPAAARALLRSNRAASDAVRLAFLDQWIRDSDPIRDAFKKDALLQDIMWLLMPRYKGAGLVLYRGGSAHDRRHRSYGPAWSSSREVARDFALEWQQTSIGGSVLLRADAPATAIICAPGMIDNRMDEDELLVDRRKLSKVEVVERFPEIAPS